MKTRKPRLSQTEQNAVAFCDDIKKFGNTNFSVVWVKSPWGHNPNVTCNGKRVAYASGYGYCKESTALASALYRLAETPEGQNRIRATGGAGANPVIVALESEGWVLTKTYSGKNEDGWKIERTTK